MMCKKKYNFDEICKCLEYLGYGSVIKWWNFRNELLEKKKEAFRNGCPDKEFYFNDAFEIVKTDGTKHRKECKFANAS